MGKIDLDAGESRKIIAESVDAVEEFVEAVSGEIFLSEKSTVPSDSADPIPEGDRTDVTAREGTAVYARAAPRGNGAEIRVGNAGNGINVNRRPRRVIERPGDRSVRTGVSDSITEVASVNSGNFEVFLNEEVDEPTLVESVSVYSRDETTQLYRWKLRRDTRPNQAGGREIQDVGMRDTGQHRNYDPGKLFLDGHEIEVEVFNGESNTRTFRVVVLKRPI